MHILVVDDLEINRKILSSMLHQQGHLVSEACHGNQAIELAALHTFDIVLLDVMMPVKNGIETAPILKQQAGDRYLPIIFLTSLDDQQSTLACLESGGDDFLSKPYDMAILSAKIKAFSRSLQLAEKIRAQNQQLSLYQKQVETDHAIVERIFENLFQQNRFYEKVIDFHLIPASSFNGDLVLTNISPTGNQYALIGDFTGHGLAAAIGALPLAQVFFDSTDKAEPVAKLAAQLNQKLLDLLPTDRFCAATIIELNADGNTLTLWSGGMPDCLLVSTEKDKVTNLPSQHMSLGILDSENFDDSVITLEIPAYYKLLCYTDGLVERLNNDRMIFADDSLKQIIQMEPEIKLQEVIKRMNQKHNHQATTDDISLLEISPLKLPQKTISSAPNNAVSFNLSVTFNANDMRNTHPVDLLLEQICAYPNLNHHRSVLYTILSEAYNNALEHGVLRLNSALKNDEDGYCQYYQMRQNQLAKIDDAQIHFMIKFDAKENQLHLEIVDSGDNFQLPSHFSLPDEGNSYGWGLMLLSSLCDTIELDEKQSRLSLTYKIT